MSFADKGGRIVVDAFGAPIDCPDCPCDTVSTTCCPGALPMVLHATIGGAVVMTVTLAYDAAAQQWCSAPVNIGGCTGVVIQFACTGSDANHLTVGFSTACLGGSVINTTGGVVTTSCGPPVSYSRTLFNLGACQAGITISITP